MRYPFLVFPWSRPFLRDMLEHLDPLVANVLILPNKRPRRYIIDLCREKTGLVPKTLTLQECAERYAVESGNVAQTASLLDRVALLFRTVKEQSDAFVKQNFGAMSLASFWPWGVKLARLFEDIVLARKKPENIPVTDDLSDRTKALLGALGSIFTAFADKLAAAGLTTEALELARAASAEEPLSFLTPSPSRHVYICGFYVLTGVEDALFRRCWETGCRICLHADAKVVTDPAHVHHASAFCLDWMRSWGASCKLAVEDSGARPKLHFFVGYDCHSELADLETKLAGRADKKTALLLSSPALLPPTLHHLPKTLVNISLGYPVEHTPFGQFLATLFRAREHRRDDGLFYWKDLRDLIAHPYFQYGARKAETSPEDAEEIRALQTAVVTGKRYQDGPALFADHELAPLATACFAFLESTTLAEFAARLAHIGTLLEERLGDAWESDPIDSEAYQHVAHVIVPKLACRIQDEPLPFVLLAQICSDLLANETISFEGEPLLGLQVIGLLETRLLDFSTVYVLDATDDLLPGIPGEDSLIPDIVRRTIGLPTVQDVQLRSEYVLMRLLSGCQDVYCYWQEGMGAHGVKRKSRFLEEMIWAEECAKGALLDTEIERASVALRTREPKARSIARSPQIAAQCKAILAQGISATFLDNYLTCPYRLVNTYFLPIKTLETISEGDAPNIVGTIIHKVLQRLFEPYLEKEIEPNFFTKETLLPILEEEIAAADLDNLPAVSYYFLKTAAETKLLTYAKQLPKTEILALERRFDADFTAGSSTFRLSGYVDRLDRRDDKLLILDYKTNTLKIPPQRFWEERELFARMSDWVAGPHDPDTRESLLAEIRAQVKSVQLPFYIVLCTNACQREYQSIPENAALVELAEQGKEHTLFGVNSPLTPLERQIACQGLIGFLLTCIQSTEVFSSVPGDTCEYCAFADLCLLG